VSTIRLPAPLRFAVAGEKTVPITAATVADLAPAITAAYPGLAERVLRDGAFGSFVTVFLDGEDLRFLEPQTPVPATAVVEILPAMSGGE
jgi:molybdopterin converting factor small subunit